MRYEFDREKGVFNSLQPHFKDINEENREIVLKVLKLLDNKIPSKSVYVYGSILHKRFNRGISDLDLLIYNKELIAGKVIQSVSEELSATFSKDFSSIGIEQVDDNILSGIQKNAFAFLLRHQSAYIKGENIHKRVKAPEGIENVVYEFNHDYIERILDKYNLLLTTSDERLRENANKRIAKRLLRLSLILTSDPLNFHEDNVAEIHRLIVMKYPEWKIIFDKLLNLAKKPSGNKNELDYILVEYYPWIHKKRKKFIRINKLEESKEMDNKKVPLTIEKILMGKERKKNTYSYIDMININDGEKFKNLYDFLYENFSNTPGSINEKHQWREGGYYDHINNMLDMGNKLLPLFKSTGNIDFDIENIIKVVLLHDIEKPFKYFEAGKKFIEENCKDLSDEGIRTFIMEKFGIVLNENEINGIKYIHGEGEDYSETERIMKPLSAFCHILDVASARIFFDK